MSPKTWGVVLSIVVVACGGSTEPARPQWIVHVGTDLPVPQFGDRVLVELLGADGMPVCAGCRRLFGVREGSAWPLSFGIPDPGTNETPWLRVRLFRADHSDSGGAPLAGLGVDVLGRLPPTDGRARDIAVSLAGVCAGIAADTSAGLACVEGRLAPLAFADGTATLTPGSFAAARGVPCPREPRAGMACVDGALFARGNAAFVGDPSAETRPVPEHLVRVSPFALDVNEMTVRAWRALVARGVLPKPIVRGAGEAQACNYTEAPGDFEDHPMNCIDRKTAAAACAADGKRLPTEAEWELAAGNGTEESRFPWGPDVDACAHAIVGRGRTDNESAAPLVLLETTTCRGRSGGEPIGWGTVPVSVSPDVTFRGFHDLGGNVSEWVADDFEPYDGPCSASAHVLVDPRCVGGGQPVVRGGNWASLPIYAQSFGRLVFSGGEPSPLVGVRCAESF